MGVKFEGLFEVGQRIRAYDYNPALVEGRQVFLEGCVVGIVNAPFRAYVVECDICTGYGRVGKQINVPMEVAANEFDGRIISINS
jgi:hypothetical protein